MTAVDERRDNGCAQIPYGRADEHRGREIFAEPAAAAATPGASWDDAGGPMVQPPPDAVVEERVQAALAHINSDEGRAAGVADVVAHQGKQTADRLAEETARRRDLIEVSHDVAAAAAEQRQRDLEDARAAAARERMLSTGPDRPGVNQLSELGRQRWNEHCARSWGVPPEVLDDDAAAEAWMDEADRPHDLYETADDAMEAGR